MIPGLLENTLSFLQAIGKPLPDQHAIYYNYPPPENMEIRQTPEVVDITAKEPVGPRVLTHAERGIFATLDEIIERLKQMPDYDPEKDRRNQKHVPLSCNKKTYGTDRSIAKYL